MREILFRGKRESNGEWVYGDLFKVFDDGFFVHDGKCHSEKVIPETVGQYTGLTDKNGKKIFEGDIVSFGFQPFVVKWDNENSKYMLFNKSGSKRDGFNMDTMQLKEVIGNIHDNPESLKELNKE